MYKTLFLVIFLFAIQLQVAFSSDSECDTLANQLIITFSDPSVIIRQPIITENDTLIGLGIGIIDSLNIYHEVESIIKVDRSFGINSIFPGKFIFIFKEDKADIVGVSNDYLANSYDISEIEFIIIHPISWQPQDVLFNRCDEDWPFPNEPLDPFEEFWWQKDWTAEGHIEQWGLKNDGTTSDNCGCGEGQHSIFFSTRITDKWDPSVGEYNWILETPDSTKPNYPEDIRMTDAWSYYFQNTPSEDSTIDSPGDSSVLILMKDDGIEWRHVDLYGGLWNNPLEKNQAPNAYTFFNPDLWWSDGGDSGDVIHEDSGPQYPGAPGDDDSDGFADWDDPEIQEIIFNLKDNDGDGSWHDEPNPLSMTQCDCPHSLVGFIIPEPHPSAGYEFTAEDLGIEGEDDDGDGYIDECDGAIWDDDENGFIDDVIGWNFSSNNNKPHSHNHGATVGSIMIAQVNNEDPAVLAGYHPAPHPNNIPYDVYEKMRVGMAGICPDCRLVVTKFGNPSEVVAYAIKTKCKVITSSSGSWGQYGEEAFDSGMVVVEAGGNVHDERQCPGTDDIIYRDDDPYKLVISCIGPNGECVGSKLRTDSDLSAPGCFILGAATHDDYVWADNPEAIDPDFGENAFLWRTFWNRGCGTSNSAPHVAGVAGLLFSFSELNSLGWTNRDIYFRLLNGAKIYDDDYWGFDVDDNVRTFGHYHRDSTQSENWMPMGVGRLDAYGALTLDSYGEGDIRFYNEVSILGYSTYGQNDGKVQQGELIGIITHVFNYGGPLENVQFILSSMEPDISIIDGTSIVGSIGVYSNASNAVDPFLVQVSPNALVGDYLEFSFNVVADGYQSDEFPLEPILVELEYLFDPVEIDIPIEIDNYSTIGDVDSDGLLECIQSYKTGSWGNYEYFIKAINLENGNELWTIEIPCNYGSDCKVASSIGNIDDDQDIEVVLYINDFMDSKVMVLSGLNGSADYNTLSLGGSSNNKALPPVLTDWGNNGDLDIFVAFDNKLIKIGIDGNNLFEERIFLTLDPWINIKGIAFGDLDDDGYNDFVVTTSDDINPLKVFTYDNNGFLTIDHTRECEFSIPVLGDINDDGKLDIVMVEDDSDGKVVYYNYVPIPEVHRHELYGGSEYFLRNCHPSLGDVNADGVPEIIFYNLIDDIIYIGNDSEILQVSVEHNLPHYKQMLITDVNSDSYGDIIFRTRNLINIINNQGDPVWNAETCVAFETDLNSANLFMGDFNGDELTNCGVVFNTPNNSSIVDCRNTKGIVSANTFQWPQYQHDARHTGLYAQPVDLLYITQDMTIWDNLVVWQGIRVSADASLTIKPGVTLMMKPDAYIRVEGELNALGNASEPIVFTCTEATPGSWEGIYFAPGAAGNFKHCSINYADIGIKIESLPLSITEINLENCTIKNMSLNGINNKLGRLTATNCSFEYINNIGIFSHQAESVIDLCDFRRCDDYGIYADLEADVLLDSTIITNCLIRTGEQGTVIGSQYGIRADLINRMRIEGNVIRTYAQGGIHLNKSNARIHCDTIRLCAFNGIYLSGESDSYIDSCHFDTVYTGIYGDKYSKSKARWCLFGNVNTGVYLTNSSLNLGTLFPNDKGFNDFEACNTYYIYNEPLSPVACNAINNYFGRGIPDPRKFVGAVNYIPFLDADPFPKMADLELPLVYQLNTNYPNPFNPNTHISYSLADPGYTTITIYNILGQKVTALVDEYKPAGYYSVIWNGKNKSGSPVSSGVYFYRLVSGDFMDSKKMLLLR